MYKCKYCNKEYENHKSIGAHTKFCKLNPNRDIPFKNVSKEYRKQIDLKIAENRKGKPLSDETKKKLSKIWKGRHHTKETKIKISETMKKNSNCGGYRIGSGRCKGSWYDSPYAGHVYLDSSYELIYAKYLDVNKIKWLKNKKKFPYFWKGMPHNYIPDFYLIESDEYIETKGFSTRKDIAKWKHFPFRLTVLYKTDLDKLIGEVDSGGVK